MSDTANRNLSREKIQQVLASIGSQEVDGDDKVEAAEYNWHQPRYFSSEQLKKLDSFTENVAQSCAEKFTKLYNTDFNVTITLTTHQAMTGQIKMLHRFPAAHSSSSRACFRQNPYSLLLGQPYRSPL